MSIILTIVVFYFLCLFMIRQKVKDRISKYLILIYVSYWHISLLLCSINPFGYFHVKDSTYLLLLGHVVTFLIGFIIVKIPDISYSPPIDIDVLKLIKKKLFLFLFTVSFIFVTVMLFRVRDLLLVYAISDVRGDFGELVLEGSGVASLFYNVVARCVFHFSLCLVSFMLFFQSSWRYISLLFTYILLFAIIQGGRNQFLTIGFYILSLLILSSYIQSRKKGLREIYDISRSLKVILIIVGVGIFFIMSYLTAARKGYNTIDNDALVQSSISLSEKFGTYSAGPIVAFDQGINGSVIKKKKQYYGAATFGGVDKHISILFNQFGIKIPKASNEVTYILQENRILIGPDLSWNYAYTSCFNYYMDFGLLGILVFPFIFGIFVRNYIALLYRQLSIYTIALFSFICFCMYMSVFSGYLHKDMTILYIIMLLYLSHKNNKVCLNLS